MHAYLKRALQTSLLAGGFVVAGITAAAADEPAVSSEVSSSVTTGHEKSSTPLDGVLDPVVSAVTSTMDSVSDTVQHAVGSDNNDGIGNGNIDDITADVPVTAPVNVFGNSVSIIGSSETSSTNATSVEVTNGGSTTDAAANNGTDAVTADAATANATGDTNDGIANGNIDNVTVDVPVTAPVNVSGNSVSVIGSSSSDSHNETPIAVTNEGNTGGTTTATEPTGDTNDGIANGNIDNVTVQAPINLPINLSGNAITLIGSSSSDSDNETPVTIINDGGDGTDGIDGTDGTDGTDGADGTDGTDGSDGTDGTDGTDGSDGTDGTDGTDGADGANGPNDGSSADAHNVATSTTGTSSADMRVVGFSADAGPAVAVSNSSTHDGADTSLAYTGADLGGLAWAALLLLLAGAMFIYTSRAVNRTQKS